MNLIAHGIAEDLTDALRQSFTAGLDMEMGGNVVAADGTTPLTPDDLTAARVDDAVRRVLRLKVGAGALRPPLRRPAAEVTAPTAATRAAAREAAERCPVLLANDGTLPLADGPLRVLLTGPYADSTDHLGAWVQSFAEPAGSLADALRAERPDLEVTVLPGASFDGADPARQDEVARAAAGFDVVLVAVGEPSHLTGEASSRADLRLPGDQEALVHAVADTGVPFAVVLANGRPLVTSDWIDRAPAVLEAWHLGLEAAPAIARVLTGAVNPAGRLPMSFPRSVGQVPVHYDHESTGRPATTGGSMQPLSHDIGLQGPANVQEWFTSKYRDLPLGPQFAFGHGLSYTTFAYGTPVLSRAQLSADELRGGTAVEVSVEVTNTGQRAGDEVVAAVPARPGRLAGPAGAPAARLPAAAAAAGGDRDGDADPRLAGPGLLDRAGRRSSSSSRAASSCTSAAASSAPSSATSSSRDTPRTGGDDHGIDDPLGCRARGTADRRPRRRHLPEPGAGR